MIRTIIIAAAFVTIAGCQTVPKSNFCSIAAPTRLSDKTIDAMTDAEVADALAFNRKGQALCGWRP